MYIMCGWFENSIDEILNLCPSYVTNRTVTLPSKQVRNIRLSVGQCVKEEPRLAALSVLVSVTIQ